MENKNYDSKITKRAILRAEYLKGLKAISYDEIVKRLKDKNTFYQIQFYDKYDVLNDINYHCVSLLEHNDTSKAKEYLSADKDVIEVYNGLIEALIKNGINNPTLQIIMAYDGDEDLVYKIGDSVLIFPRTILRNLLSKSTEEPVNPGDICCVCSYRVNELFFPRRLEKEKEKNNAIK